jgi:hypothetical protein
LRDKVADGIDVFGFTSRKGQLQRGDGDISGHAASIAARRNALQSRLSSDRIFACFVMAATRIRAAAAATAKLSIAFFEQQCHPVGFANRLIFCAIHILQTQRRR